MRTEHSQCWVLQGCLAVVRCVACGLFSARIILWVVGCFSFLISCWITSIYLFRWQVSIPLGKHDGRPVSLSFVAAHGADKFLLDTVLDMDSSLQEQAKIASALQLASDVNGDMDASELLKEKVFISCSSYVASIIEHYVFFTTWNNFQASPHLLLIHLINLGIYICICKFHNIPHNFSREMPRSRESSGIRLLVTTRKPSSWIVLAQLITATGQRHIWNWDGMKFVLTYQHGFACLLLYIHTTLVICL